MKKIIIAAFMLLSASSFAQSVKNGTIYKSHPYITAVNESMAAFVEGDTTAAAKLYADSVRFYDPSSAKPSTLADARKGWKEIFDGWEQISFVAEGYPDGLEYANDPFAVQSWWTVTFVNKATKKKAVFKQYLYDIFNKDGKVIVEIGYYDPSAVIAAMK